MASYAHIPSPHTPSYPPTSSTPYPPQGAQPTTLPPTVPLPHPLTPDTLLSHVSSNALSPIPLSPQHLILLNPYALAPAQTTDAEIRQAGSRWRQVVQRGYAVAKREMSMEGERNGVPDLAARTYWWMSRTGEDAAIVLSGETSSGKSHARSLLLRSIINYSAAPPGKKGGKLVYQLPSVDFILDTFSSASTLSNPSASRYGRYTEVQFNDKGRLYGMKSLEYFLEKRRVTETPLGERNFNVFYALIAGSTAEERVHLGLPANGDSNHFKYLSRGSGGGRLGGSGSDREDGQKFTQLKQALKNVGFSKKNVADTFKVLAAILHLGNLDFRAGKTAEATAEVSNRELLPRIAEFLGIKEDELENCLVNKLTMIGGERCAVLLDEEGAEKNRDELAKTLYGLLFSWIVEFLNQKFCKEDFTNFIGIVDFPGSQLSGNAGGLGANGKLGSMSGGRGGGLEEFCVNLANERLMKLVFDRAFEDGRVDEYKKDGVDIILEKLGSNLKPKYFSNADTVRLLTHQPGGLVHIISDQSTRNGKSDSTMLKAMGKRWSNHSSFGWREGVGGGAAYSGSFAVNHWDGQVNYEAEGFLEKNKEQIGGDWVTLFAGAPNTSGHKPKASTLSSIQKPGSDRIGGSVSPFVKGLFLNEKVLHTEHHPRSDDTIVAAKQNVGPARRPSVKKAMGRAGTIKKMGAPMPVVGEDGDVAQDEIPQGATILEGYNKSLDLLMETISDTRTYFLFCLRPNDAQLPSQIDSRILRHQIRAMNLSEIGNRMKGEWSASLSIEEFWERYADVVFEDVEGGTEVQMSVSGMVMKDKVQKVKDFLCWTEEEMTIGREKVYLSDSAFRELEDLLRAQDEDEMRRVKEKDRQDLEATNGLLNIPLDPLAPFPTSPMEGYGDDYGKLESTTNLAANVSPPGMADDYPDDSKTYYSNTDDYFSTARGLKKNGGYDDDASALGSERFNPSRNMFDSDRKTEFGEKAAYGLDMKKPEETVVEIRDTSQRKKWVFLVWLLTWWIPSFLLSWPGKMKRRDVRMAWREKLAINMLIWTLCAIAVFVIAVLGNLICPREFVYTGQELSDHGYTNNAGNMLVSINGEVFDLTKFAPLHSPGNDVIPTLTIQKFGGSDISDLFPLQPSALCNGVDGTISPFVGLDYSNSSTNLRTYSKYHDFRASTNDYRPDWYYEQMIYLRYNYRRGFIGFTKGDVHKRRLKYNTVIYRGGVYDMTDYINAGGGVPNLPENTVPPGDVNYQFMDPLVVALFQQRNGQDISKEFDNLPLSEDAKQVQRVCLRNLFFIGKQDNRRSAQCLFSQYILLALSIILASVIGFKFLAALQFGKSKEPEDHEKFVICQVPCYTEGEESLRKCIDSLTQLKYDDKRKLIFVVCDGMIIGSGNDRPTPRIVLDILRCDPTLDPEPLSFLSIGEGAKQHNMAKVYSGLYESAGHIVPYIVVVKVGKPSERSRPGNRGKRDSQMLIMRFLNRVHFDAPMAPLELEIFHQIKNVIGVNPTFYEYILQVDADTVVDKLSLNRMVSSMMHDKRIMGLCGETSLANARHSFTTMIQVYEYFISHHLAKAFESLFGSVTCLPGCFSLYRIRTTENKPLLVNSEIVHLYGENRVDTLHMKNLLHLGEDRYLTTIMLKTFPTHKNIFIRDAYAQTIAPDEWSVLFSQRRRWINSTVHNLAELLMIERMCGFCLFSMRFVVFIDLFSTLIAPVSVAYIVYLVYLVVADGDSIPITSIILLASVYGLQALIFIFHRKFEHIGWMVVYILAIPIFSFILPLASFWQMDNFSWGNTRVVLGEKGQRLVVHDEGKFDPSEIPLKRWHEYEEELWERGSNKSIGSLIEESKRKAFGDQSREGSLYGRQSVMGAGTPMMHSRAQSRMTSAMFDQRSMMGGYEQASYQPSMLGDGYNNVSFDQKSEFGGPARSTYSGFMGMGAAGNGFAPLTGPPPSARSSAFFGAPASNANQGGFFAQAPGQSHGYGHLGQGSQYDLGESIMMVEHGGHWEEGEGWPGEEKMVAEIRELLANADLNTITKKSVRKTLEEKYGTTLQSDRKEWVNREVERALGA